MYFFGWWLQLDFVVSGHLELRRNLSLFLHLCQVPIHYVSLTYYLPLTAGNSQHLSIHWPGGDKQDLDATEIMGEWKTVRLTAPLVTV